MHRFLALGATLVVALVLSGVAAAWSWPADGEVLRSFELGSDTYAAGQHRGIDVAGASGSPVRAPAAGTVTFAGSVPTHGRGVTILTADGYSVTLFHLESVGVVKGDTIAEGATVGTMGSSGDAEHGVPTVHLGIRVADRSDGYVDPVGLLPARPVPPPASPPATPATIPVSAPAPAPTTPQPPVQPTPTPTPTLAPPPPAAAPAAPTAAPPLAAAADVSPPAVTASAPEATGVTAPTTAPSTNLSSTASPVDAAPGRAAAGVHVVADSSRSVGRGPAASAVVRPEPVGRVAAHAERPVHVDGDGRPGDNGTRAGDAARQTSNRAVSAEPAAGSGVAGSVDRPAVESRAARVVVQPAVRDDRPLGPIVEASQRPSRQPLPPGGTRPALGQLAEGPGSLPASIEVPGPGRGLGLAELVAALVLLALVAGRIAMRAARRIGPDGAVLPDDADLLRQLDAAHRPRLHDGRGRRVRAPSAAARS